MDNRRLRTCDSRALATSRAPLAFACFFAFAVTAGCETGPGGRTQFLSIGTAGTGGLYYPIGGALASRLTLRDSARTFTAEVTGGSVENIQRVAAGQMDLAFAIGTTVYEAFHGGQDFPSPVATLRVVAPLYGNLTHVLVRDGANIASLAELRGRRVSVGAAGSGTEQVARQLLDAVGLTYDDVGVRYLSFTESAAALADGAIDAAIFSVGFPASAVLEATTTGRVGLLPIGPDAARTLSNRYPYYSTGTIPASSYPGVENDVATVSVMNWIVAHQDLDAAVVESVLDILADEQAMLQRSVEIAGQIRLTNLYAAPIPLHDAARTWLDAHGAGPATAPSD